MVIALPVGTGVISSPHGDVAGQPTEPAAIYAIRGAGVRSQTSVVKMPAIVPVGVEANQLPPWAKDVLSALP